MKTDSIHHPEPFARFQSIVLIALLVVPTLAIPRTAFGEDELPAAPSRQIELRPTAAMIAEAAKSAPDTTPTSQQAAAPATPPAPALQIAILEGEDVSNNIKERTAREPIVQVTDENHKPVAGAAVLFTVQSNSGHAGATFLNGAKTYAGHTDAEGRVTARGFHPNTHAGQFHVNVTVTKGNLKTQATFAQQNVVAATSAATTGTIGTFIATHVVLVSAVAAGAVAAGVATGIAVSQSSSTSITAGTGTVGAPAAIRFHGVLR